MATIGAAPTTSVIRRSFYDVFNEHVVKSTTIDGTMTNPDMELLLECEEGLSNLKYSGTSVTNISDVTGLRASAIDALERNVSNRAFLTFSKNSPLDATKTVYRTFTIPGFKDALQNPDGSIITPADPGVTVQGSWTAAMFLFVLVDLLENNLDYEAADGNHYPGGWTYQPSKSGTGTTTNEIDGA